MKKHQAVQGTFSRLFGRKHAQGAAAATSLFATNPPWIFTQEVTSESAGGTGDVIEVYYGENRFGTMTDSGTATLKPRPRVRPLLTFLPLNAQESHGVAVPTPSVPDDFDEKAALGSQVNGGCRLYGSEGQEDSAPKAEFLTANDLDLPPPDYPCADEDWKEASNLSRLKHELVALLSSSKREERQVDRPVIPRPVNGVAHRAGGDGISSDGLQLTKPVGKDSWLPKGGERETRAKIPVSAAAARESSSGAIPPAPQSNAASSQPSSVMRIRNELEAMLSLKKEGKPSLGLGSPKQSPEDGGASLRPGPGRTDPAGPMLPKPAPGRPQPVAAAVEEEKVQEDQPVPGAAAVREALEDVDSVPKQASSSSSLSAPEQPKKPKDELPVSASPSPSSSERFSPVQSPAPQPDALLLQYKPHRARADSTDQLSAASPGENGDGRAVDPRPAESAPGSLEPPGPTEAGRDDVLIHPVTGERVERGSPMALLLAAKQRAQRGRPGAGGASSSRTRPSPRPRGRI
ncbi:PREDICTED: uncharacterized protein C6orf132 homolog [Tinamus guttatus]|uniref:uncharacterized protein C6orf132 homolog n=1 Tax=Tinamus guttatus TaxID=94827 RepID=UPI00052F3593|nr:PREDICTED: uncharacterized protein C6orf132 homolog [Tinamus guttatus]